MKYLNIFYLKIGRVFDILYSPSGSLGKSYHPYFRKGIPLHALNSTKGIF